MSCRGENRKRPALEHEIVETEPQSQPAGAEIAAIDRVSRRIGPFLSQQAGIEHRASSRHHGCGRKTPRKPQWRGPVLLTIAEAAFFRRRGAALEEFRRRFTFFPPSPPPPPRARPLPARKSRRRRAPPPPLSIAPSQCRKGRVGGSWRASSSSSPFSSSRSPRPRRPSALPCPREMSSLRSSWSQ